MTTKDNLAAAFAGESQANRKYLAFAGQAEKDGLPQVAKLFRAAAAAETVHAHAHLKVLGGVGSTTENIQAAIEGEGFEFQEMYPDFIKTAEAEGDTAALKSFNRALPVEEIHHGLYQAALAAVQGGGDLPAKEIYVCGVCGNTIYGAPDGSCSICNHGVEHFKLVD